MGDFIARTKFKKGRPAEFELENKSYTEETEKFISSPRTYIEKRIGILDFDIADFLNMSDAKQVEYVAKNLAVDFSDIEAELEELLEGRKFDNKKLKELKLKENYYKKEDAEKDLIDIVAISKEIEAETVKSNNYNRISDGVKDKLKRVREIDKEIAALMLERDGNPSDNEEDRIIGLSEQIIKGETWLNSPDNALMSDEELAEKIKARDTATATNKTIQEAKDAKQVDLEIEKYEKQISEYNEDIEKQRELKAKRISEVLSIPELTYSMADEKFLYEGRPFDKNQTNTASQLIIGMRIASMMLKDLKILRVDASLIDKDEFDKVLGWATENDIELFVELVDREATQLKIEVVDE